MPKTVAPLTQLQVRNAKPKEKAYKLADGGGLYLEVTPKGGKLWRMKFRQPDGTENRLSFGVYPEVSLIDAREKRDQARKLIAAGKDPARDRDDAARQARMVAENTFEKIAREWHTAMLGQWQPKTAQDILHRLEVDIFSAFGDMPITEVQPRDVLQAVRAIESRGALEIASRTAANCSRVFRYAIRAGIAERNPAETMRDVMAPRKEGHFAAIESDDLPAFLRALYANEACMGLPTRVAMKGKPSKAHAMRVLAAARDLEEGAVAPKPWEVAMAARRRGVVRELTQSVVRLRQEGDTKLADDVERFIRDMPALDTEQRAMQRALVKQVQERLQQRDQTKDNPLQK